MRDFWPELSHFESRRSSLILSVRDPDEWYTSCSNTIFAGMHGMIENGDAWMAALLRLFADRFSDQITDRDAMTAAFEKHNAAVRAGVPKERLLEWTTSDGWDPICERLGVACPGEPFPQVTNTTAQFREMIGMPPKGAESD